MQLSSGLKKRTKASGEKANVIFYVIIALFPLAQFAIFYVGVNFNSLLMAFKSFDTLTGSSSWVGFSNLEAALKALFSEYELVVSAKNSLVAYIAGVIIGVPLALLFSYYIYKKMFLHGLYKIVLFVPSILSIVAMSVIFSYFSEKAVPEYVNTLFGVKIRGLLSNPETAFGTLIFFANWISFGPSVLMYSGAMNAIPESVPEAATLDGATPLREFLSVTLPMIYPTIVTFLVIGVAGIFTGQLNIYSLLGTGAETYLYTFGYYLYRAANVGQKSNYPFLSSLGIIMTAVAVPLTFLVKYALEKAGPKCD